MFHIISKKFTVLLIVITAITIIYFGNLSMLARINNLTLNEFSKIKNDLISENYVVENGIYTFFDTKYQYTEDDLALENGVSLTNEDAKLYLDDQVTTYSKEEFSFDDFEEFYAEVLVYRFSPYYYGPLLIIITITSIVTYLFYQAVGYVLFKIIIHWLNRTIQNYKVLTTKKIIFLTIISSILPIFVTEILQLYNLSMISYLIYCVLFLGVSNYVYKNLKKIGE